PLHDALPISNNGIQWRPYLVAHGRDKLCFSFCSFFCFFLRYYQFSFKSSSVDSCSNPLPYELYKIPVSLRKWLCALDAGKEAKCAIFIATFPYDYPYIRGNITEQTM